MALSQRLLITYCNLGRQMMFYNNDSPSVLPRPAASAPAGNLLEIQIFRPWRWSQVICVILMLLKHENHYSRKSASQGNPLFFLGYPIKETRNTFLWSNLLLSTESPCVLAVLLQKIKSWKQCFKMKGNYFMSLIQNN